MENPDLYDDHSDFPKAYAAETIPYLVSQMKWKQGEKILDFGCGPGYITKHRLLSILEKHFPDKYREVTGVDICSEMIEYAALKYSHPQINYLALDIMKDKCNVQFDKIFSFFVIHWIPNWSKLFKRLYNLVVPGGEIGYFLPAGSDMYTVWKQMSKDPVWGKYYQVEIDKGFPETYYSPNPAEYARLLMESAGFIVDESQLITTFHDFPTLENFYDFALGINPVIADVPVNKKPAFVESYCKYVQDFFRLDTSGDTTGRLRLNYKMLLVRAHKKR